MRRVAVGPGNWASQEDLWHLRECYGQAKSFRSIRIAAWSAQVRAATLEDLSRDESLERKAEHLEHLFHSTELWVDEGFGGTVTRPRSGECRRQSKRKWNSTRSNSENIIGHQPWKMDKDGLATHSGQRDDTARETRCRGTDQTQAYKMEVVWPTRTRREASPLQTRIPRQSCHAPCC